MYIVLKNFSGVKTATEIVSKREQVCSRALDYSKIDLIQKRKVQLTKVGVFYTAKCNLIKDQFNILAEEQRTIIESDHDFPPLKEVFLFLQ